MIILLSPYLLFFAVFDILKLMELYYSNIAEFMDLKGIKLLNESRQMQVLRYRQTKDKARCLVGGLLMKKVLNIHEDAQIVFGENKKPYLATGKQYFNLSHSGDYVVLGVCSCEIGVDIEKVAPYSTEIAQKCFTKKEQEWLFKQNSEKAFYSLWTGKESIMKACGKGFLLSPESFSVLPVINGEHKVFDDKWFLNWSHIDGHEICVATDKKPSGINVVCASKKYLLGEA